MGFDSKKKNSDYFIVTVLAMDDKKVVERIVKKVHQSLRKKVKKISGGVLHSYKEKPDTRKKLLSLLSKEDISVMTICLNKSKVYTSLKDEEHVLYNYVVNILLDRIMSKKLIKNTSIISLVAAKRETNKFLNLNFMDYLGKQAKENHSTELKVLINTPSEEKALQATDFVSWSIFRKYERKDLEYYSIFKKKIVEENILFY